MSDLLLCLFSGIMPPRHSRYSIALMMILFERLLRQYSNFLTLGLFLLLQNILVKDVGIIINGPCP
ncbi:MAG: hypothetical protein ACJAVV_001585 [Alphaproteobacteria bacterium]|jgi:hypothetical protein